MLGRGACKRVFAAFDTEEGIEVAWNLVELQGVDIDADFRAHLFAEIKVLQQLKHRVRSEWCPIPVHSGYQVSSMPPFGSVPMRHTVTVRLINSVPRQLGQDCTGPNIIHFT
jgi:hypothetical protein